MLAAGIGRFPPPLEIRIPMVMGIGTGLETAIPEKQHRSGGASTLGYDTGTKATGAGHR